MPGSHRSLDQKRAAFAWERTDPAPFGGPAEKSYREFAVLATSAPALVMGNGLMQALAFYKHKGKKHHEKLLDAVLKWLAGDGGVLRHGDFDGAMRELAAGSTDLYFRATEESIEILKWVRQFAKARMEKKP